MNVLWLWLVRWEKMPHEKLFAEAGAVGGFGGAVACVRERHEVEGLVSLLKCGDDLHGAGGIDVGVEFADDEEQVSFEFMSVFDV